MRVQSATNLRQLFTASKLYSNERNLALNNAFIAADENLNREQSGWWFQLTDGGYLGEGEGGFNHPRFYKVLGSPIQRNEVPELTIDRDPPVYCTYGMNGPLSKLEAGETRSLRSVRLIEPSRTLLISEGHLSDGNTWFAIAVDPWGQRPNTTDGIVTFIYADGHLGQILEEEFPGAWDEKYSDEWYFWKGYE